MHPAVESNFFFIRLPGCPMGGRMLFADAGFYGRWPFGTMDE
jgi:hypothetical protein